MRVKNFNLLSIVYLCLMAISLPAMAQQNQANESIKRELQPPHKPAMMEEENAEELDFLDQWLKPLNLEIEMGYTLIFQAASDVNDHTNSLLSGSYDIGLVWTPWENGTWEFGVEGGQILSHNDDEDLGDNVGSNLGINDDLDNLAIVFSTLFYSHSFADDALVVTVGKFNQSDFFDANEIANDETTQFLAGALVNNLTIPFPDDGLGVNFWANLTENFYVTGGMGDNNAVGTYTPFKTVDDGDYFYAMEGGYINTAELLGNYRLTLWHSQNSTDDGSGIAISIDQHITSNLVLFGRWGMGDEKITDFEQFASAGLGIESPFGREGDMAGIGVAWANPSDKTVSEETIVEAFYRYQLNDLMELSPSVQAIIDPAGSPDSETVYVVGLRLQTTW